MTHRIFKPWYHLDFVYKMTKMYPEQKRCSKITYGFIGDMINNKKRAFNATRTHEDEAQKDGSFKTPQIFIDQLLKLEGNYFNDWDMLSEASTIVAAVSEMKGRGKKNTRFTVEESEVVEVDYQDEETKEKNNQRFTEKKKQKRRKKN